jgi:hypothetical protein
MMKSSIKSQFIGAIALYASLVLVIWFGYYAATYGQFSRVAKENAELAAGRLTDRVSAEIVQMKSVAEIIAASTHVQDFLSFGDAELFYDNAGTVSEIIRNAAYLTATLDNVIAINAAGNYYRFTGGLSNAACALLFERFQGTETAYQIVELDGILFFCHSTPIFTVQGQNVDRVGTVILLTNLNRKRAILSSTKLTGINTAVMQDGVILLANDESLEGKQEAELNHEYELVLHTNVAGTNLSIAAVVTKEALFPGRTLFFFISFILLAILLVTVIALYRYLSAYMVRPMTSVIRGVASLDKELKKRLPELPVIGKADFHSLVLAINDLIDRSERNYKSELEQRDMQIGLLNSQIDAHFMVNVITSIHTLVRGGGQSDIEALFAR